MNDDILTLYYYNDGLSDRERRRVADALAADPALALRYRVLCRELEDFAVGAPSPPAHVRRRWHEALDRAADAEAKARMPVVPAWSLLLGAAVTVALALGIGIGVLLGTNDETAAPDIAAPILDTRQREADVASPFVRSLKVHLRESGQGLSAFAAADAGQRTGLIMKMIEQNRLYEAAAMQNGADDLARVLRAFEQVLVQLAAEDITPVEAEALQSRLLFELNVVLTKLTRQTSEQYESI